MSSSPLSFSMESILQSVPSVRKPDSNGLSRKLLCNASSNTAAAMQEEQGNQTLQYSPSSVKSAPSCSPFYQSALQEFSSGYNSQCARKRFLSEGEVKIITEEEEQETDDEQEKKVKEKNSRPRRGRMRFTPEQIHALEQRFQEQHYLLPADRKLIALALKMTERQVKTWFQNKRAQYKRTHPLIRNPIYHNFRRPHYAMPSLSSRISHFSLSELHPSAPHHTLSPPKHIQILPIAQTAAHAYGPMLS